MEQDTGRGRGILLRDLIIFQIKLLLDGLKDLAVAQIALLAAAVDFIAPGKRAGRRFYAVMGIAERFDHWLSLYGDAERAASNADGLFGASRAGAATLLGRLEEWVTGRIEVEGEESDMRPAA